MLKRLNIKLGALLIALVLFGIGGCAKKVPNEIRIGGIFAMSGPTSDVGVEYGQAVIDYIKYINETGGINNRQINLIWKDYQYKISDAYIWYEKIKASNVIAIVGWGTGDTEALAPKVSADCIPYISASYSEKIANGNKFPYNFIGSVSYSDQARIALKFIKKEKPNSTVAFIYNDTGFGRSPFFPDAEKFAKEVGVNVTEKFVVPLSGEGAKKILSPLTADWAIIQETGTASIAVIKAVKELGLHTKLICLNWAMDENVANTVKEESKEVKIYSTIPYGIWNETNLKGINLLHKINKKYHPEITERSCRYIQGYVAIKTLLEAAKNAGNNLTGEGIKKELEKLENYDTGASFNVVNYSQKVHKPSSSLRMYIVKDGKLVMTTKLLISVEQKIWEEY